MTDEEFAVRDHRRFDEKGDARSDQEDVTAGNTKPENASPADEKRSDSGKAAEAASVTGLPEVSFSTFIFSMSTSALMHLGEVPDPNTGQAVHDIKLAKQTIDILGMLQQKTDGNLTAEEENLLKHLLYELRLKYVAAVRK